MTAAVACACPTPARRLRAPWLLALSLLPLTPLALAAAEPTYGGRGVKQWSQLLASPDENLRRQAAYALGSLGPDAAAAVPALIVAVDDRKQEVRWYSAYALGRIGPEAAAGVDVLEAGIRDPANDAIFVRAALTSLGRIGPAAAETLPLVTEKQQTGDGPTRAAAALARWRIEGASEALETLQHLLAAPSGGGAYDACRALAELGPEAAPARAALLAALSHADGDVRRAAADALAAQGPAALEPLAAELARPGLDRVAALHAVGVLAARQREDVLYDSATATEEFDAAARPLLKASAPAAAQLLGDEQEAVRRAAGAALAEHGLLSAPALLAALRGEDAAARGAALDALRLLESRLPRGGEASSRLGQVKDRLVSPLVAAMQDPRPEVRAASIRLFAELRIGPAGSAAAPLLRNSLRDEDAAVRRDAARALEGLGVE